MFICQALPVRANSDCCPSFLEEEDEVFSIDLMSKMTEGEGGDNGDEVRGIKIPYYDNVSLILYWRIVFLL